mgnify:CR=1 FL=1
MRCAIIKDPVITNKYCVLHEGVTYFMVYTCLITVILTEVNFANGQFCFKLAWSIF